jgi:hypothetical protein
MVATFVRSGYRKRASVRAIANTLISFSSKLTLTLTLSFGLPKPPLIQRMRCTVIFRERVATFFFEEYEFLGRVATGDLLLKTTV